VTANRDQLTEIFETVIRLASNGSERLDLKITNAALKEMADAFAMFAPTATFERSPCSGRPAPAERPAVRAGRELAACCHPRWSTMTGAGPGSWPPGWREPAPSVRSDQHPPPLRTGRQRVHRREPEAGVDEVLLHPELLLIKESFAYAVLPGGFGTLDEAFELLTLIQTGKASRHRVLLEVRAPATGRPGSASSSSSGVTEPDQSGGCPSLSIVDTVEDAAAEILGFYRNYTRSLVGDTLVLRLENRPSDDEVAELSERFADARPARSAS